ncbi:MAG TPA: patatin-like phospholipase family protein [Gammaproteobacteria bacterium]
MSRPKFGIALGGGAARGWAHIGVLRALAKQGLRPDCIAGVSIGALVGAASATDQLDKLEAWVRALSRLDVLKLLDARFRGGVIQGDRVMSAIKNVLSDHAIEDLPVPYGAVATDIESGREIWLRKGSLMAAVRASCALPGLFAPSLLDDRWLIDGGLVNPVPVSLCYAMGADLVVAVNLNAHSFPRFARREPGRQSGERLPDEQSYLEKVANIFEGWRSGAPGVIDVLSAAIGIMQQRIARSRLAGEPPEVEIRPLVDVEFLDFHRAAAALGRLRGNLKPES